MAGRGAKKKPSKAASTAPRREEEFSNRALSELEGLRKTQHERQQETLRREQAARAEAARRAAEARAAAASLAADDPDDATLFEEAVAGLRRDDVYRGKFGGRDPGPGGKAPDEKATSHVEFAREMASLGATPLPSRPQRVTAPPSRPATAAAPSRPAAPVASEQARSVELDKGQRRLVDQVRKLERESGPIPTLTLRGLPMSNAMVRLDGFLQEHQGHSPFVRVITGKGKQSEAEPVLKGAAAERFRSWPGLAAWAPEVTRDGDFGAYVLRFKNTASDEEEER